MGRLLSLTAALGTVALITLGAPAAADPSNPKNSSVLELDCDTGTFEVVVNSNGDWSPAHDVDSNAIFVPTWFGEGTGTVTDSEGNVIDSFTEPPATKGAGKHAIIHCTFEDSGTFQDPELGELTFSFSGSVAGFVTPRRR
jgi:hypothetical protein